MDLRTGIFFLWTFVLIGWPQDIFQSLQVARPALVLGIMTLILIVLVPTRGAVAEAFQSPEGRKYVLLYLIMIVGIPFAYHKRVAFEYTILSYGVNVLYFMACALIVDSVAKLRALMFVMVAATCWYGVVGLAEGVHSDGRLFMVGSGHDPNDLAFVLIALFPASAYFIVRPTGLLARLFAGASLVASLGVILLSGSRGGLLGLAAVILAFILTGKGRVQRAISSYWP